LYLVFVGRTRLPTASRGWNWIIGGFCLLLFGSLVDITDNFETLNRFVVIGDTETEAFLEKFVGFLGGFIVLAIGLVQWIPQELAERKQAEEELAEKEALLRITLEHMPGGIFLADANYNYALFNDYYKNLYDVPDHFIEIGKPVEAVVRHIIRQSADSETDIEERVETRMAQFKSGEPGETTRVLSDGQIVRLQHEPIEGGGIASIITDITERKNTEEELRESQETMRALADNLPEFITLKDSEGRFLFVNKRFEEWGGMDRHDVVGKTVHDIYPAEQAAEFDALDRKVMTDQSVMSREVDQYYPDGSTRTVISTRFPVVSSAGETIGLGIVNIDITERKRAEEELQRNEALLSTVFDTTAVGMVLHAADGSKRLKINDAFCNHVGYSRKHLLGEAYDKLTHPEDLKESIELRRQLVNGDIDHFQLEKRYIHKKGHAVWGDVSSSIIRADGGEVIYFVSFIQDITERKRAEEELRNSQALLTSSIETMNEGFVLFGPDDRLVVCNDVYREMFPAMADKLVPGARYTELLDRLIERGQYIHDGMSPAKWREIRLKAHRAADGEPLIRKTSEGRWIISRERKMPDGSTVGVRTDITELKQVEEALRESEERLKVQVVDLTDKEERLEAQAADLVAIAEYQAIMRDELQKLNQQKDKSFSIIAHDLKGPFNALLGYSSLLADKVDHFDKKGVVESAAAVHESAQRVFKLLENLLEWSRLQMGQLKFEPGPVDLKEIIDTNLELYVPLAKEKAIRLTGKRRKSLNVFADAHMVDAIVRNLVNNAIKFTPEKGKVTISARRNGKWAEVEVSDTGVGISADKAARLFRLDEKTSTVGTGGETGTGLGLHLCKEMVERQGGRIQVKSTEGEGSAFRFTLPLHQK
jgi:PAS domain S-box-containing protein